MQQLSNTLKEAIRGSYQSPLAKIEIINPDGSTAGEILDVIDCAVNVAGSRNILRNIKISLDNKDGQYTPDPDLYDRNLLWYNKKMKLYYGYKTDIQEAGPVLWGYVSEKAGYQEKLAAWGSSGGFAWDYAPSGSIGRSIGCLFDKAIPMKKFVALDKENSHRVTSGDLKVFVSDDNTTWREVTNVRKTFDSVNGKARITIDMLSPVPSRYWKFFCAAVDTAFTFEITAFTANLNNDNPGPFYTSWNGSPEEWLPQGVFNINSINPEVDPNGTTLQLEGQDRIEDLIEDQFDDIYKVEVTATESVNYALGSQGGSASASSSISAGDEIQDQAVIHYAETFATVNGLETAVINETVDESLSEGTINLFIGEKQTSPSQVSVTQNGEWEVLTSLVQGTSMGRRHLVPAASLVDNEVYSCSVTVYNPMNHSIFIHQDWCDQGNTLTEIMPGETKRISLSTKRNDYDSTYRFYDIDIRDLNDQVWIKDVQIEKKASPTPYVSGTRPDRFLYNDYDKMINKSDIAAWAQVYTPESGSTVTEIESEIFVDLQDPLQLQEIKLNLIEGAELTDFLWTSPDNATWTSSTSTTVTPVGDVRFIRFKVRKRTADADGKWRLGVSEIQIKTAKNFTPSLAIDGDIHNTDWRPRATDPDPVITFDLGQSRSINALYTYWGKNSFDFWNRVKYFIETSVNGSTWSRLVDLNGYDESRSFYGEVEHVFAPVSVRYVRINIKGRDGVAILRHIRIMSITASKTIRDLMIEVLQTTNLTDYEIPFTRRYVERKMAEIGDEKEAFLRTLARSANWDTVTDENGVYKAYSRNIDPVDYAWDFKTDTDNIFSFSLNLTNDIKNVIVVTYETTSEKAIVGRAIDDNPLSPTSVSNLGRRVVKYSGESYNSQEICDRVAQERLFEKTRQKHQTTLPVTGHPGIQVDDVVQVTVEEAKVRGSFYLVTGYETTFRAESAEFDTRINISQL
jgi:hypothetical protein